MRWFQTAAILLAALMGWGCYPRGDPRYATEHWRSTIESEVLPRAARDLQCPEQALDFTCRGDRCKAVTVLGCGSAVEYEHAGGAWVRVRHPGW